MKNPRVFPAGDFVSRQQPFFFRASFGMCTIAVPFVAFVGSLVLVSGWFGLGFVYFLGYLCFTHCASLYVDFVFVVRDGCEKDCFIFPG